MAATRDAEKGSAASSTVDMYQQAIYTYGCGSHQQSFMHSLPASDAQGSCRAGHGALVTSKSPQEPDAHVPLRLRLCVAVG